jgi:hypothetical protein
MPTPPNITVAGQRQVLAVGAHAFLDLGGEFARRREDQRADHALARILLRAGMGQQALQDRQREAGGLAGAGLGAGEQVAALQSTAGMACNWIGVGVV